MIGIGKVVRYWLHIGVVEDRTRILRPHQHSVGYLKLNFFQESGSVQYVCIYIYEDVVGSCAEKKTSDITSNVCCGSLKEFESVS